MTAAQILQALANYFPIEKELVSTFNISNVNISHTDMKVAPSVSRSGNIIRIYSGYKSSQITQSASIIDFATPIQAGSNGANLNIVGYAQDGYGWYGSSFYVDIRINSGSYTSYYSYNSNNSDYTSTNTDTPRTFNININIPANSKAYIRIRRGVANNSGFDRDVSSYITSLKLIQKTL